MKRQVKRTDIPTEGQAPASSAGAAPVVVVGTGPAGIKVVQEILRTAPEQPIALYGNEPWEPYDRIRLSSLLAGDTPWRSLLTPLSLPGCGRVAQHYNCPIVAIDRARRVATDALGRYQPYSSLVLATGSRPHIPAIPGIDLPGVFTFRDMNDVQRLTARRVRSRRTLVLGGGLLGLEAARAMQRFNTEVVLVHHSERLMNRQLDTGAAALLRRQVNALGIRLVLGDSVAQVTGDLVVTGVRLRSGETLACDTLVVATGISPNVDLALSIGLAIGRGIRVNDSLQTTDPRIFAVGECAEHRGRIYGLVRPGLEQAAVAANRIMGGNASYAGSMTGSHLKVAGLSVHTVGETGDDEATLGVRRVVYQNPGAGLYRSILLRQGRPVGAVAIGEWPESGRLQDIISRRRRLWPWQVRRFAHTGKLWRDEGRVAAWPAAAVVCNCTGVTRGQISSAIAGGCHSVEAIRTTTGASSVCGACTHRVAELAGSGAPPAQLAWRALLTVSLIAILLVAALSLLKPWPADSTVQGGFHLSTLWLDSFWKQVTGFTLAGLSALLLLVSARKRWKRFNLGRFSSWRLAHAALGSSMLLLLAGHTGLRLGVRLDFMLLVTFLGLAASGAGAGLAAALEGRIGGRLGTTLRAWGNRLHLWFFWVFPLFLGFHVLKVYYF